MTPPDDSDPAAERFAAQRQDYADQVMTIRHADLSPIGTLDDVEPLSGAEVQALCARQIAVTAQRIRYLEAQLAAAERAHGVKAFVRENLIFNPEEGTVVVASESPTGLARAEADERDRWDRQVALAHRIGLERVSAAEREARALREAAMMRAAFEACGLDWAADETRTLAQAAIVRAYEEIERRS